MRITIEVPGALHRKTKAAAALRGSSMKDLIIQAVEREVTSTAVSKPKRGRVDLPLMKSWRGKKLDLTNFDFDELLG